MQKYGTGQIIQPDGEPVRKTAAARPLSEDDVRDIEAEGQSEGE